MLSLMCMAQQSKYASYNWKAVSNQIFFTIRFVQLKLLLSFFSTVFAKCLSQCYTGAHRNRRHCAAATAREH